MALLDDRKGDLGAIEARFIRSVLEENASEILKNSKRAQQGFSSPVFSKVNMTVTENTLTYSHPAVMRFVDMKTRSVSNANGSLLSTRKRGSGKKRKKNYPVHNKPIMRQKRFIIKALQFGFTQGVQQTFRELLAQENNI